MKIEIKRIGEKKFEVTYHYNWFERLYLLEKKRVFRIYDIDRTYLLTQSPVWVLEDGSEFGVLHRLNDEMKKFLNKEKIKL